MAIYLIKEGVRFENRYINEDEYDHLLREFALGTEEEAQKYVTKWYNKRAEKDCKSKMLGEPKDGQMGAWFRYEPEWEDERITDYCYYRKINLYKYNG